jgi:hypothetical protein
MPLRGLQDSSKSSTSALVQRVLRGARRVSEGNGGEVAVVPRSRIGLCNGCLEDTRMIGCVWNGFLVLVFCAWQKLPFI